MRAARIILDRPDPIETGWCWREDWITGFDSAYGLFSKFASLNAMGAREVAHIFASRVSGRRTAILRAPNVDLRTSELFDLSAMASILRLDSEQIRHAFLLEKLATRRRTCGDHLRWCPQCAKRGFHTAVFQLDLVTACPVHGCKLRCDCPKCHTKIPYRLKTDLFAKPFTCPSCKEDFAPALRTPTTRSLRMRESSTDWITNLVTFFTFEDEIVPVKMELNRRRRLLGIGEAVFSTGDWRRIQSEYTAFVTQALEDLRADTVGGQRALAFNQVSLTLKLPIQHCEKPRDVRRRRARPMPVYGELKSSSLLKKGWDAPLQSSYLLYSAVRRHLWRHVVRKHRDCTAVAARQMWWHMEGERTTAFCPVAEAFLRWRMYWEGCGTPRHLLAPMTKDPLGLVGWLGWGAPICPLGWTWDAERWVADHILARTLLGSFREFLQIALRDHARGKIFWNSHALTGKYESYWAIAGKDTPRSPVRLYEQYHNPYHFRSMLSRQENGAHRALNRMQVARIVR